jgi:pyruvate dehydrogenase E2 component (dihydrolipoamide acetyltransferase)
MPRLSDTMTEGTVATWLKKVGDKINEGDILAEIETDKATMEFESFNAGTLLYIGVPEGQTAAVDSLLAIIGKDGEDISQLISKDPAPSSSSPTLKEVEGGVTQTFNTVAANPASASSNSGAEGLGCIVVTMPRLSDTMTDGTVANWLKKVGDLVKEGDILAEIETDKATMEFESFNAGTLLYIGVNAGETAPVDSLLAIIGPSGTDVSGIIAAPLESPSPALPEGEVAATQPAKSAVIEANKSTPTAPTSGAVGGRIFISPLARKIAEQKGINPLEIKGTGENGRIVKSDVENFKSAVGSVQLADSTKTTTDNRQPTTVQAFVPAGEMYSEKIPNSTMRKVIAKRLSESIFTAPHFYLTIEVNMDEAMKSRATINTIPDTKVSFNDMVIKACAMGLKKHLKVNSQWKEDAITINHHINIGVAVAVEDGLVVPVLKFTDQMSLTQIGNSVRDLAGRAKNKKLTPAEMDGSTFTVSNLGMFGITEFTSIINQPNSAILSVGAIVEKPVVKNGQIVVGNTMKVTLACDHRTVDGATGAQFLQTLKLYLENPVTMLA